MFRRKKMTGKLTASSFLRFLRRPPFRITLFIAISWAHGAGCSLPRDVHGTAIDTLGSAEDPDYQKQQVWWQTIQALTPDGTEYKVLSADVDEDGKFFIAGVPGGPYWLSFPDDQTTPRGDAHIFVWTDASEFDLGRSGPRGSLLGTARLPMPTPLTGLLPVQQGDWIEAYATSQIWSSTWMLPTPDAIEATWPSDAGPIPLGDDPSDRIIVKQWRNSVIDGVSVQAAVRAGSRSAPVNLDQTLSFALSGSVPAALSASIDHGAFMNQLSGLAGPFDTSLTLLATIDPSDTPVGVEEKLLRISNVATPGGDPSASGVSYVDPYPASWSRRFELHYLNTKEYPVEGTSVRKSCNSGLIRFGTASELQRAPLRPILSLPQAVAIDGSPAMVARDRVALSPTITWQAPALGTVSFYVLRLVHLVEDLESEAPTIVAGSFLTPRTEVTIPPGVLQPGMRYYLELIAVTGLGSDALTAPRIALARSRFQSSAHVCSATFNTR